MPRSKLTGARIRARRLARKISQASLARQVGISASYLNLIEHDRRRIAGKLLVDIAHMLEIEPALLAEGAQQAALDALHQAAGAAPDVDVELDRIDPFADAYPGWAGLIAVQARKIKAQERALAVLSDRMAQDPVLSASLHDVLSTVTAIRATSAILQDEADVDPEWRARFYRNLSEDSQRLAETAQHLAAYLAQEESAESDTTLPQDEVEAWLAEHDHHFPDLAGTPDPATLVDQTSLSPAAKVLAAAHLTQYAKDVAAAPHAKMEGALQQHGVDPFAIAQHLAVAPSTAMRRLASLPEGVTGGPVGLAICDASGTLTFRKQIPDFAPQRFGSGCPLWPLYQVLADPVRPVRQAVHPFVGAPRRLACWAVADISYPAGFDGPLAVAATMLVVPDDLARGQFGDAPARAVGTSCRICAVARCPTRREPSILPQP